jgi:hypothetical protein
MKSQETFLNLDGIIRLVSQNAGAHGMPLAEIRGNRFYEIDEREDGSLKRTRISRDKFIKEYPGMI